MVPEESSDETARQIRVPIGFPSDTYEWLRETAFRRHSKMAEIVRQAVHHYREHEELQLKLPIHDQRP